MLRLLIVVVVTLALSTSAWARPSPSAREFLDSYDKADAQGRGQFLILLRGFQFGVDWSNTYLGEHNEPLIYCELPKGPPTAEEDLLILRTMTDKVPEISGYEFGLVLIRALHDVFPCPSPHK